MITLEQAKVGASDYIDKMVIETFRQNSLLLDMMIFDDAVTPGYGSTMTYKYMREEIPSMAQFREINKEYEPNESKRKEYSADIKIFGGAYEIDRVIESISGRTSEVVYQTEEKVKATINLFYKAVIMGDSDADKECFDGLDKALRGSVTEVNAGGVIDLSTADAIDANYKVIIDMLDESLSELCSRPSCIMANTSMINKLKQVARRAGYMTRSEDAFGRSVDCYDGIPFLDMKYYPHKEERGGYTEKPIIPIQTRTVKDKQVEGLTDIYFPVIGRSSFHGVTVKGDKLIKQYLPNFDLPGAVKKGEVEMVAAIALKSSRGAGVLRNIKIK